MLAVAGLCAAYGPTQVLFGVELAVAEGECVTLMGRNGMGKTTTVRAILGLVPPTAGSLRFAGEDLRGLPPHRIARLRLGLVPEGRQVFRSLTVEENLVATARGGGPWTLAEVYRLFPGLRERRRNRGHLLSGGEQQMLAIGRALMTNPRLLILDEATEGLAPLLREEIWACLAGLRRAGQSILLIDKHVERLLALADRHVVLGKGRTVWAGTSAEFRMEPLLRERWLGV
ncbi:MAG TPA: ABC transporter ATP-binding protein [Geminicoccaceae bacterium]|nr:ABC transporter ATP-binding protein [Geminicoccaceae bacterium]